MSTYICILTADGEIKERLDYVFRHGFEFKAIVRQDSYVLRTCVSRREELIGMLLALELTEQSPEWEELSKMEGLGCSLRRAIGHYWKLDGDEIWARYAYSKRLQQQRIPSTQHAWAKKYHGCENLEPLEVEKQEGGWSFKTNGGPPKEFVRQIALTFHSTQGGVLLAYETNDEVGEFRRVKGLYAFVDGQFNRAYEERESIGG